MFADNLVYVCKLCISPALLGKHLRTRSSFGPARMEKSHLLKIGRRLHAHPLLTTCGISNSAISVLVMLRS